MNNHDKEKKPSSSTGESEALTPWQKEHLLYLESQGISVVKEENHEGMPEKGLIKSEVEEDENQSETLDEVEGDAAKSYFSFSEHLPNFKAYRDKKLRKRLLILVSLYLVPLLGAVYYISPLSKVSAVTVGETPITAKDQLIESSQLREDQGLWTQFFNRGELIKDIEEKNPRVKSATITLHDWNQLKIQVVEYPEVAYLVKGNQYLPILENGKILQEPRKEVTEGRVILENFTNETLILETLKMYRELPEEIQDAISQIKYAPSKKNDELLTIFMNDGNQVLVSVSQLTNQMKYYLQVAKEMTQKGVIDMEVGIYSYPYSSKESKKEGNAESSESF